MTILFGRADCGSRQLTSLGHRFNKESCGSVVPRKRQVCVVARRENIPGGWLYPDLFRNQGGIRFLVLHQSFIRSLYHSFTLMGLRGRNDTFCLRKKICGLAGGRGRQTGA